MAYNESLGERIDSVLAHKRLSYEAKEMMGGLVFMVNDKMCVGIIKNELMVRIGSDGYADALTKKGCHAMEFGRKSKSFVLVNEDGIDLDDDLEVWIDRALAFNAVAKKSKKKRLTGRN